MQLGAFTRFSPNSNLSVSARLERVRFSGVLTLPGSRWPTLKTCSRHRRRPRSRRSGKSQRQSPLAARTLSCPPLTSPLDCMQVQEHLAAQNTQDAEARRRNEQIQLTLQQQAQQFSGRAKVLVP